MGENTSKSEANTFKITSQSSTLEWPKKQQKYPHIADKYVSLP